MPIPRCSVVIPARNRAASLRAVLDSLSRQTIDWGSHEIIVADNDSTDDTAAVAASFGDLPVRTITVPYSGGFEAAAVRNAGVAASRGELVLFLDADVVVPAGFVDWHVRYHDLSVSASVIGSVIYVDRVEPQIPVDAAGRSATGGHADPLENLAIYHSERISGTDAAWLLAHSGNLSVPRCLFERVGGFDERFVTWSIEDLDLGWRLQQAGAHMIYTRRAFGCHLPHPTEPPAVKQKTVQHGFSYMMGKYPAAAGSIRRLAAWWEEETERHRLLADAGSVPGDRWRRESAARLWNRPCPVLTLAVIAWTGEDAAPLKETLASLDNGGHTAFEVLVMDAATGPDAGEIELVVQMYAGPVDVRLLSVELGVDRVDRGRLAALLRLAAAGDGAVPAEVCSYITDRARPDVDDLVRRLARGRVIRYLAPGDTVPPGWVDHIARMLGVVT